MRRLLARSERSGSTFEAEGPDLVAILDFLDNVGDEEDDEGEEDGKDDEEDEEAESEAVGPAFGSEPASEADSAETWPLTLNYLIKLSYLIYKIFPTGLISCRQYLQNLC